MDDFAYYQAQEFTDRKRRARFDFSEFKISDAVKMNVSGFVSATDGSKMYVIKLDAWGDFSIKLLTDLDSVLLRAHLYDVSKADGERKRTLTYKGASDEQTEKFVKVLKAQLEELCYVNGVEFVYEEADSE